MHKPLLVGLLIGACISCGEERPDNAYLLAKVGEVEITATDLRTFEANLKDATMRSQRWDNLQTLIDREVLLLEADERGLQRDEAVLAELAKRETKALADAMLRRNVAAKVAVTEDDIEKAYSRPGWGEKVVTMEIFVPSREQARQVQALLAQGEDFAEIGRQFAADPYYGVHTGEIRRLAYSPFDSPRDLAQAVFALPVGGVTEPLSLHGGFVIAKVAERRRAELVEVEDGIREALGDEQQKQLRESYLRHLKWDLDTVFDAEGMAIVVGVLQGAIRYADLAEAQRQHPVYAFEGLQMDVAEVLEAVRPSGQLWSEATADSVNEKLSESHFPTRIMAHDARRKGLDKSETFARSHELALGNLMLIKLREQILAEAPAPTEEDLQTFYEEHKQRFRSPPHAQLEEILLETPSEARQIAAQIEAGAEWSELARAHSQRRNAEDGLLYVSQSQAPFLGEAWMNAVMSAELHQLQGPIQTRGGYSVFRVIERYPEIYHGLELERVRNAVERDVRERNKREFFNSYLRDLRQKYAEQIDVYEEHLRYLDDESVQN
ncbi:MAG: peptidyl-prolyl cis-trans isomerase [Gemmatimonadota bacterium]|nr:peptidyl-prolyl cis-trans isomerase [Gemmatimonadota bacterium]